MSTGPGGLDELVSWRVVPREFSCLVPDGPDTPDLQVRYWCERVR